MIRDEADRIDDWIAVSGDLPSHTLVNKFAGHRWKCQNLRPRTLLVEPGWERLLVDEVATVRILGQCDVATESSKWSGLQVAGQPALLVRSVFKTSQRAKWHTTGCHDRHQRLDSVNKPHCDTLLGWVI